MTITFEKIVEVDNGARFVNADLHIHSFGASECVHDDTMTVEEIIEQALAQNLSIISITDHNSDKNIENALDYAQKYAGRLLVIPGVEITTAHGHLLAYFPPESWDNVRNLLARIEIVGKPGAKESHTTKSMADVIRQVELLNGFCIAAHIDRLKTGFELLAAGYPNWKKDIILSSGLYGLEVDNPDNLIWYSVDDAGANDGAERRKLLEARAKTFTGRPVFAHIQGSDAHSIKDLIENCSKRNLIKIKINDLSYKALRTAMIDPEARVRATLSLPVSFPKVRGMFVSGGFLDEEAYHFSDNLNCFIGGRGTGKSTAIKSLAYGLGIRDELASCDNCPDTVIVYCEDANGVAYKYERNRGGQLSVRAREDGKIQDVPVDVFPVEYYGQGELAEVAKDPLGNPALLQQFLDKHLHIGNLEDREQELIKLLNQNAAQLIPLEIVFSQLPGKILVAKEIDTKLKIAEEGKLKEIAGQYINLGAERIFRNSLIEIANFYNRGISFTNFIRDYKTMLQTAKVQFNDEQTHKLFQKIEQSIILTNQFLNEKQLEINRFFKSQASEIIAAANSIDRRIIERHDELTEKITPLKQQGLSGNVQELQQLIETKGRILAEINRINSQRTTLDDLRTQRQELKKELFDIRTQIINIRKGQLKSVNKGLSRTITDYLVFLHYDTTGIIDEFKDFLLKAMKGTYLQEEVARKVCSAMSPDQLANLISKNDANQIATISGITLEWASQICGRLQALTDLYELEVMWKPPCPIITVRTKGTAPKDLRVTQLSDGQKHTILLTIAMLADSRLPLIIDQPEDDLDNAFISSSVVNTLRTIKERRQVVVVTHNANIAVLGDAELLFPMKRRDDKGIVVDRGSIDRIETQNEVVRILEGGDTAFKRRKEIYGH